MNLRVYVTNLEEISTLYNLEKQSSENKNLEIINLKSQNLNKDSIIGSLNQKATYQSVQLKESDKKYEKQLALTSKYQKRSSWWPRWFGAGGICGIILCLMLNK